MVLVLAALVIFQVEDVTRGTVEGEVGTVVDVLDWIGATGIVDLPIERTLAVAPGVGGETVDCVLAEKVTGEIVDGTGTRLVVT